MMKLRKLPIFKKYKILKDKMMYSFSSKFLTSEEQKQKSI